jgi:BirA family biotin operon repressor/biotin-[acetyl-CoA-carboxylase] ligase
MAVISETVFSMPTKWLGKEVFFYHKLNSTNTLAIKLSKMNMPHGTVIWAKKQLAGRGRGNKSWYSPKDNGLYFSIILYPPLPFSYWPLLSLVTAAAIAKSLEEISTVSLGLKWPNDIWAKGKKIGGILIETYKKAAIVGVGININQKKFPPYLKDRAISLFLLTNKEFVLENILTYLLLELERSYDLFFKKENIFLEEWQARNILKNRIIILKVENKILKGRVLDIDTKGALLLMDDKELHTIFSGEVLRIERD